MVEREWSKLVREPSFWERAWEEARETSSSRRRLPAVIDCWNKKAERFTENVTGKKGQQRIEDVLDWLSSQGVSLEGCRVLDIGAGPGAFTLPFAERAAEVVALEPAGTMVVKLRERIAKKGLKNIRVVQQAWEEVDVKREGMSGKFDLVFASMTPGVSSWETLRKALECTRKYFYLSGFAGKRDNKSLAELWSVVFGEDMPPWPADIIYAINLLYTKGYELSLQTWEERRIEEASAEETIEIFLDYLRSYEQNIPFVEDKVRKYVQENAAGGKFKQEIVTLLGKILVKV